MAVERKIVKKELASAGRPDDDFADKLVAWADIIRKTFYEGGVDEVIATRRLVHIAKAYGIWADRMKAITYCLNRFDEETKTSFMDLYTKVDENASGEANSDEAEAASEDAGNSNTETDEDLTPF